VSSPLATIHHESESPRKAPLAWPWQSRHAGRMMRPVSVRVSLLNSPPQFFPRVPVSGGQALPPCPEATCTARQANSHMLPARQTASQVTNFFLFQPAPRLLRTCPDRVVPRGADFCGTASSRPTPCHVLGCGQTAAQRSDAQTSQLGLIQVHGKTGNLAVSPVQRAEYASSSMHDGGSWLESQQLDSARGGSLRGWIPPGSTEAAAEPATASCGKILDVELTKQKSLDQLIGSGCGYCVLQVLAITSHRQLKLN
jgi:hypothetical protein